MNYRLSDHAIKQIGDRNIPIDWLEQVINLPEQVIEQSDKSKVYQSKFSNSHYGKFAPISLILLRIGAIENLEKPITSLKIFSLGNLWAT